MKPITIEGKEYLIDEFAGFDDLPEYDKVDDRGNPLTPAGDLYDPITGEHVGIWNGEDIEDVETDESGTEDEADKETYEEHTERVRRDIAFRELERMTSEERDAQPSSPIFDLYADMMEGKFK